MILNVGNKVFYPHQGPCRVGAVVNKIFNGRPTSFYPLAVMDESGDVLFVPVDKISTLGIRRLIEKSEIPRLLGRLNQITERVVLPTAAMNWKQRTIDNSKLLASGSAYDLAEIVETLTELNNTKVLSPHDRQTLERAKKLLVCEIAEVLGESKSAAEQQVDKALNSAKSGRKKSPRVNVSIKKFTA
jgi:CarD family transcriptional regulator